MWIALSVTAYEAGYEAGYCGCEAGYCGFCGCTVSSLTLGDSNQTEKSQNDERKQLHFCLLETEKTGLTVNGASAN